jgi:DNA-binding NarL/FixJ family response regulator
MEKTQPIRVVIVDDHPLFRQGLRRLLESELDITVVGDASDTAEAMKLIDQLKPDVLTTDLNRPPEDSGFKLLRQLHNLATPVRAIVLSAAIEKRQIVEAFQLGARGVVLKDSATKVLMEAIRRVRDGEYWVHREPVSNLKRYLRTLMKLVRQKKFGLKPRQLEIVSAVVAGYSNQEIAEYFKIGEDTVKRHLNSIFDKLGVSTRLELALFAVNNSLPLPPIG